jgi:hypothetical protein
MIKTSAAVTPPMLDPAIPFFAASVLEIEVDVDVAALLFCDVDVATLLFGDVMETSAAGVLLVGDVMGMSAAGALLDVMGTSAVRALLIVDATGISVLSCSKTTNQRSKIMINGSGTNV